MRSEDTALASGEESDDFELTPLNEDTDAARWAREFVALFGGHTVGPGTVDEGLLISWFANAIEAGRAAGKRTPTEERTKTVYQAPSGFKLMPEHPTSEMLEAIEGYFRKWQRILPGVTDDDVKADAWSALHAYHAMYEIAPVSPQREKT